MTDLVIFICSLPRITEQVSKKASSIDEKLSELPEPPVGNLPAILMLELTNFSHELKQHMDGGSHQFPLQKMWMNLALHFRKILADSRPALMVRDKSETPNRSKNSLSQESHSLNQSTPTPIRGQMQPINLSSDEEKPCAPTSTQRSGKKRPSAASLPSSTPPKKPRFIDIPQYGGEKSNHPLHLLSDHDVDSLLDLGKRFDLSEIRNIVQDAFVAGVPNQVHPKAIERMCTMSVAHWEKPLVEFLRLTGEMVLGVFMDSLDETFGKWKQTKLYAEARAIIHAFVAKALMEQRTAAHRSLMLETTKPMTLNTEAQSVARADALATLEEARWEARSSTWSDEQECKIGRSASGQGKHEKPSKAMEAQIGADPFNQEVQTMAVRADLPSHSCSMLISTRLSVDITRAPTPDLLIPYAKEYRENSF